MKTSEVYEERYYREYIKKKSIKNYNVTVFETDLQIYSDVDLKDEIKKSVEDLRKILTDYIERHPEFNFSLYPVKVLPDDSDFIRHMKESSRRLNVGPMATVAGAISHYIGFLYKDRAKTLIIENGGDIYISSDEDRVVLIDAGKSKFGNKLNIKIDKEDLPVGICTSSGKMGHSLSFGKSDAVVIISKDTLLADATATAVGNFINCKKDIETGIEFIKKIDGIDGAIIIAEDSIGAYGKIKFV
jgi:ApbE superfamily uncharacterized protein (UPF0280 family)